MRNPWEARDALEGSGKGKLLEVLHQIPCANADGVTAGMGRAPSESLESCTCPGARAALQPQGLRRRMLEEVRLSSCMCRAPRGAGKHKQPHEQQRGFCGHPHDPTGKSNREQGERPRASLQSEPARVPQSMGTG